MRRVASSCFWSASGRRARVAMMCGAMFATTTQAAAAINGPVIGARLLRNDITYSVIGMDDFAPFEVGGNFIDVSRGNSRSQGLTFEALSDITDQSILFKNSIIGSGPGTSMRATIGVEITIDNRAGDFKFEPVLRTKLLAAGMGIFAAAPVLARFDDDTGRPIPALSTDCAAAQLKNCAPIIDPFIASTFPRGTSDIFKSISTGFDFNVTVEGESKFRMNSSIGYDNNGVFVSDLDDAQLLDGFRSSAIDGQLFTTAYAWDDTFKDIDLGNTIKPGDTLVAVYTITTFINIAARSGDAGRFSFLDGGRELAITTGAFAAFGDPIGGSSSIDTADGEFSAARFFSMAEPPPPPPSSINTNGTGVFDLPFFAPDPGTGEPTVIFNVNTLVPAPDILPYGPPDVVPEPSAWAMLIAGFGLIGAALRRRRIGERLPEWA